MNIIYLCSDISANSNSLKRYYYFQKLFNARLVFLDFKFLYKSENFKEIDKQNRDLFNLAVLLKPEIIFMDKILTIKPTTLIKLKKNFKTKIINFTNDNPFSDKRPKEKKIWNYFLQNIKIVDANFFSQDNQKDFYIKYGSKKNFRMQHGYDPRDISNLKTINNFKNKITFIGNYEKDRFKYLFNLENEFKNKIYFAGPNWWKSFKNYKYYLYGNLKNQINSSISMCNILFSSKVNLGLLSITNEDLITRRTYEIISSKGFGIFKFTTNHQELFDKDQMYFEIDDLIEKIKFYLNKENIRKKKVNKTLNKFIYLKSDIPSMIQRWITFIYSNDKYTNDFNEQIHKSYE